MSYSVVCYKTFVNDFLNNIIVKKEKKKKKKKKKKKEISMHFENMYLRIYGTIYGKYLTYSNGNARNLSLTIFIILRGQVKGHKISFMTICYKIARRHQCRIFAFSYMLLCISLYSVGFIQ